MSYLRQFFLRWEFIFHANCLERIGVWDVISFDLIEAPHAIEILWQETPTAAPLSNQHPRIGFRLLKILRASGEGMKAQIASSTAGIRDENPAAWQRSLEGSRSTRPVARCEQRDPRRVLAIFCLLVEHVWLNLTSNVQLCKHRS